MCVCGVTSHLLVTAVLRFYCWCSCFALCLIRFQTTTDSFLTNFLILAPSGTVTRVTTKIWTEMNWTFLAVGLCLIDHNNVRKGCIYFSIQTNSFNGFVRFFWNMRACLKWNSPRWITVLSIVWVSYFHYDKMISWLWLNFNHNFGTRSHKPEWCYTYKHRSSNDKPLWRRIFKDNLQFL